MGKCQKRETNWDAVAIIQRKMVAGWTRDIREEVMSVHWIYYILKRYPTKLAGCGVCRKDKKCRMISRLDKGT